MEPPRAHFEFGGAYERKFYRWSLWKRLESCLCVEGEEGELKKKRGGTPWGRLGRNGNRSSCGGKREEGDEEAPWFEE